MTTVVDDVAHVLGRDAKLFGELFLIGAESDEVDLEVQHGVRLVVVCG